MSKLKNRNKGGKKEHRKRSLNRSLRIGASKRKETEALFEKLKLAQEEAKKRTLEEAKKDQDKQVIENPNIGDTSEFQL